MTTLKENKNNKIIELYEKHNKEKGNLRTFGITASLSELNLEARKDNIIAKVNELVEMTIAKEHKLEYDVVNRKMICTDLALEMQKYNLGNIDGLVFPSIHFVFENTMEEKYILVMAAPPSSDPLEVVNANMLVPELYDFRGHDELYIDFVYDRFEGGFEPDNSDSVSGDSHGDFFERVIDKINFSKLISEEYGDFNHFIVSEISQVDLQMISENRLSEEVIMLMEHFGESNLLGVKLPNVLIYNERTNDFLRVKI